MTCPTLTPNWPTRVSPSGTTVTRNTTANATTQRHARGRRYIVSATAARTATPAAAIASGCRARRHRILDADQRRHERVHQREDEVVGQGVKRQPPGRGIVVVGVVVDECRQSRARIAGPRPPLAPERRQASHAGPCVARARAGGWRRDTPETTSRSRSRAATARRPQMRRRAACGTSSRTSAGSTPARAA